MNTTFYKQVMNRAGLSVFAMLLISQVATSFIMAFAVLLVPAYTAHTWFITVIGTLPIYLLGIPAALAILSSIPTFRKTPFVQKMPVLWYASLVPIAFFLMISGNLIGITLNAWLSSLLGVNMLNPLAEMLQAEGISFITGLFIVVIGPVFEEFIFRFALYKKLSMFGDKVYIITSAILFGLFHGNISQLFYAVFLGAFFAYVYCRTGQKWVPIALHGFINFMGSVVSLASLQSQFFAMVYSLCIYTLCFVGLAIILMRKRQKVFAPSALPLPQKPVTTAFCTPGMLLITGFGIMLIGVVILSPLIMGG